MRHEETGGLGRLIDSAIEVVKQNGHRRLNGQPASQRTYGYSMEAAVDNCRRLYALGYKIEDINQIREKHVRALVMDWHGRGLSNKTMQNQYSRLKMLCRWLNKKDIIDSSGRGVAAYLPDLSPEQIKVSTVAKESKSWTANGIDVQSVLRSAYMEDNRHGIMLAMGLAFGLRKKEMLLIKPWKSDKGSYLEIDDNIAKNGRYRRVELEEGGFGEFQRKVLNQAKEICKKSESLGWPEYTFKRSERRYYHLMDRLGLNKAQLGVTGHGARAEYAEIKLILEGITPPTLGGDKHQASKAKILEAQIKVAQNMGHNDTHTSGAYYGSFGRAAANEGELGGQVGTGFIVDHEKDIIGILHTKPGPQKTADGQLKVPKWALKDLRIMLLIDSDDGQAVVGLDEALGKWPQIQEKVTTRLKAVGVDIDGV